MRFIVSLVTITLLLSSCSGKQKSTTTKPAVDSTCLPEGDPNVQYFGITEDECMGCTLMCETGYYPFRDECGCGCKADHSLPPDHDTLACKSDGDCALSCLQVDSCCDQLCTCDLPYNTATIELLTAWKEKRCELAVCPVAGCMDGTERRVAVCDNGQCKTIVK